MGKALKSFLIAVFVFAIVGGLIFIGSTSLLAANIVITGVLFALVWGVAYSIIAI